MNNTSPAAPTRLRNWNDRPAVALDRRRLFHGVGAGAVLAITGNRLSTRAAGKATTPTATLTAATSTTQVATTALVVNGITTFSPINYGAAGDGSTDDTTAVKAAFTAAAAVGGIVDLGHYCFLTSSPIPMPSGIAIRGSQYRAARGNYGGYLKNVTTDLFSVTGHVTSVHIQDCTLLAYAGYVFNCASDAGVSEWLISNSLLTQLSANYGIFYMPANGIYISNTVRDSYLSCGSGNPNSQWYIVSSGNAASVNFWENSVISANGCTAPFFYMANNSGTGYNSNNVFRNLDVEVAPGGVIKSLTCDRLLIENVVVYDTPAFSSSLFVTGAGSGGLRSQNITIRDSGCAGGTLGSGAYHVQCGSSDASIILQNVYGQSGTGSYRVPAAQTTIISGSSNTAPVFASSGLGVGSNAASRYVGATVGGHPVTGTYITGDWVVDHTGNMWVCTAGGTPGSWAQVGAAAASVGNVRSAHICTPSDRYVFGNATKAAFKVTLPNAALYPGKVYTVKKIDSSAHAVTIVSTAGQTIDGAATYSLRSKYSAVDLVSNGSDWFVTAKL
jgi:hypothetical protein